LQPTKHLALTLVLCCVVLAALFGLACLLDDDGDLAGALCPADAPSCSPDELSRALPVRDAHQLLAGPGARIRVTALGMLAALPGGLYLLI